MVGVAGIAMFEMIMHRLSADGRRFIDSQLAVIMGIVRVHHRHHFKTVMHIRTQHNINAILVQT